jgi:hypothetical protein
MDQWPDFNPMAKRIYFYLFTIEGNNERWYKSNHGFPYQERKAVDIWSNGKI